MEGAHIWKHSLLWRHLGDLVTSEARPSQGTWCGEAKCCGSRSCQCSKANCSQAVDSGLLLVKYTLRSRLAQPWRACHKPHGVDCAVSHRNCGVWAGSGMSCSCLVPASDWFLMQVSKFRKSEAEDERAAFAEVRGRLEITAIYIVLVSVEAFSIISTLICISLSNKQVSKNFWLSFSFWIKKCKIGTFPFEVVMMICHVPVLFRWRMCAMPWATFCSGCNVTVSQSPSPHGGESDLQVVQQLGVVSRKGEGQHNLFLLTLKLGLQLARR